MYTRLNRARRAVPVLLGAITLASVAALLIWDAAPDLFPARAHDLLGALPLAMIALAYLVYQTIHRPSPADWLKAVLLAVAFVFWSLNQFWRNPHQATVFNDIAIALFVLDVFLVMIGWPSASPDESFGETYTRPEPPPTGRDSDV
jgi:multisubunit Na+/H+ antiporter MnhG subunit